MRGVCVCVPVRGAVVPEAGGCAHSVSPHRRGAIREIDSVRDGPLWLRVGVHVRCVTRDERCVLGEASQSQGLLASEIHVQNRARAGRGEVRTYRSIMRDTTALLFVPSLSFHHSGCKRGEIHDNQNGEQQTVVPSSRANEITLPCIRSGASSSNLSAARDEEPRALGRGWWWWLA